MKQLKVSDHAFDMLKSYAELMEISYSEAICRLIGVEHKPKTPGRKPHHGIRDLKVDEDMWIPYKDLRVYGNSSSLSSELYRLTTKGWRFSQHFDPDKQAFYIRRVE